MLSLRLDPMKRALLIAIGAFVAVVAVVVAANWMFLSRPYMGKVIESWETSNQAFRVRVDQHSEENSFVPGAYLDLFLWVGSLPPRQTAAVVGQFGMPRPICRNGGVAITN